MAGTCRAVVVKEICGDARGCLVMKETCGGGARDVW